MRAEDESTMGGGFPANYITRTNSPWKPTPRKIIQRFLKEDFGESCQKSSLDSGPLRLIAQRRHSGQ